MIHEKRIKSLEIKAPKRSDVQSMDYEAIDTEEAEAFYITLKHDAAQSKVEIFSNPNKAISDCLKVIRG